MTPGTKRNPHTLKSWMIEYRIDQILTSREYQDMAYEAKKNFILYGFSKVKMK